MLRPGKPAAVDKDSAESRAMPAEKFRQRMQHDIRPVFDWLEQ